MTKPLTRWDDEADHPADLVWRACLDNRYLVEVQRTDEYKAKLVMFDNDDDNFVIHEQDVTLAYGAKFGPDVDDTIEWQTIALDVVDNPEKRSSYE